MGASEELLDHFNDPTIPDKARILRTRMLAGELTQRISDRRLGEKMRRSLNDAYLNLQLATIADNAVMIQQCRKDCVALVSEIGRVVPSAAEPSVRH